MRQPFPVFVYGTLLEGFQNHIFYVKPYAHRSLSAKIKGEVYHLPQGYPGLLAGTDDIYGTVLFFSQDVYDLALAGLDELETYYGPNDPRNEYDRIEVEAEITGTNETLIAYVYRFLDESYAKLQGVRVQDGDWRSFMLGRRE